MAKHSTKWWYLPGQAWFFKRQRRANRLAEIRARDGENCWRCGHPMRFVGKPNCGKAATIEHVKPLSQGGTWSLDNLRLCHVGCNRHLKDHAPEQKQRMRTRLARTILPE